MKKYTIPDNDKELNQELGISYNKLDSARSSVAGSGVKPTAKQRKLKFRKLLTQYSINYSKKHYATSKD